MPEGKIEFAKSDNEQKLVERLSNLLIRRGAKSYEKAKKILLDEKIECEVLRKAMLFFIQELQGIKHPGLLAIACESVGGDHEYLDDIGAALLLLLGGVHIHDDIIDKSARKEGKLTVYGKFGRDIALLLGDALLFEGLMYLHKICEKLTPFKKEEILKLVKAAFFEIGMGESDEVAVRNKGGIFSVEKHLDNLRKKAAMAEAVMRIGAIIGNGSNKEIDALGLYGRNLGLLVAIREEFIDVLEPEELMDRIKCKWPPLPVLYALQNVDKRNKLFDLLNKKRVKINDAREITRLVMTTEEFEQLKKVCQFIAIKTLNVLRNAKIGNKRLFTLLLYSTIDDFLK